MGRRKHDEIEKEIAKFEKDGKIFYSWDGINYEERLRNMEIEAEKLEFKYFLERRAERPSMLTNMNNKKILQHILLQHKQLLKMKLKYIANTIDVNIQTLNKVLNNKQSVGIDKMIKLCYLLMIPEVEFAYNLNRTPQNYYSEGKYTYPCERNKHLRYAVEKMHQQIIEEGLSFYSKIVSRELKIFHQNFNPDELQKKILLEKKVLSKGHLYRLIHNKQIPKSDTCMKIVLYLNRYHPNKKVKIQDFWWWEEK